MEYSQNTPPKIQITDVEKPLGEAQTETLTKTGKITLPEKKSRIGLGSIGFWLICFGLGCFWAKRTAEAQISIGMKMLGPWRFWSVLGRFSFNVGVALILIAILLKLSGN